MGEIQDFTPGSNGQSLKDIQYLPKLLFNILVFTASQVLQIRSMEQWANQGKKGGFTYYPSVPVFESQGMSVFTNRSSRIYSDAGANSRFYYYYNTNIIIN